MGYPICPETGQRSILNFIHSRARLFYSTPFDKSMKVGASVVAARRGGLSATFDELNKFFTISGMPVASSPAGHASPDLLAAHLDDLGLHPFSLEYLLHLAERRGGIAAGPGTSVEHEDFHWNSVHGRLPGEAAQDAEGLQTMRTLARNTRNETALRPVD